MLTPFLYLIPLKPLDKKVWCCIEIELSESVCCGKTQITYSLSNSVQFWVSTCQMLFRYWGHYSKTYENKGLFFVKGIFFCEEILEGQLWENPDEVSRSDETVSSSYCSLKGPITCQNLSLKSFFNSGRRHTQSLLTKFWPLKFDDLLCMSLDQIGSPFWK